MHISKPSRREQFVDDEMCVVQEEAVHDDDAIINNYVGFLKRLKNQYNSMNFVDYKSILALPTQVKGRVIPEINRLISSISNKDVNGNPQEIVSVDRDTFKEVTSEDSFETLRHDYFLIDKVIRDLRVSDEDLYRKVFYGN